MVTSLIETAIEIEGLLRIIKDGEPVPEVYTLLLRKTSRLAEATEFLAKRQHMKPEPASGPVAISEAAPEGTEKEPTPAQEEEASVQEAIAEEATADAYAEEQTADEKTANEPAADQQTADEPAADEEFDDDIILSLDEEDECMAEPPHSQADRTEIKAEETSKPAEETSKPAETAEKPRLNLKSYFSLNDRFLFSRELFNGDMKMFDATLRQIEGVERFSDIEDYFFNELEWNPEQRFVDNFMDILRPHFK